LSPHVVFTLGAYITGLHQEGAAFFQALFPHQDD